MRQVNSLHGQLKLNSKRAATPGLAVTCHDNSSTLLLYSSCAGGSVYLATFGLPTPKPFSEQGEGLGHALGSCSPP